MFPTVQQLILDCNTGDGAIAWAVRQWLFFLCAVSLYAGVLLEMTVQEKMRGILSVLSNSKCISAVSVFSWLADSKHQYISTDQFCEADMKIY